MCTYTDDKPAFMLSYFYLLYNFWGFMYIMENAGCVYFIVSGKCIFAMCTMEFATVS